MIVASCISRSLAPGIAIFVLLSVLRRRAHVSSAKVAYSSSVLQIGALQEKFDSVDGP